MQKKINLIIQGPILSCGKTGAQDGEIVKYDCRENISKIIEFNNEHEIFGSIVLCLWGNDPFREYDFGPITKKIIPDEFEEIYYRRSDGRLTVNNKTRQWFSSAEGCRGLVSLGVGEDEYVLKLRTDQFFDFSILLKFISSLGQSDQGKVFVPFFSNKTNTGKPKPRIHLSDYYMFGKLNILMEFFDTQLKGPEFTLIPHRDAFFKYVWAKYHEELKIPKKFYYMRSGKIFVQNKVAVETGYNSLFHPLPGGCYMSLLWRGVAVKESGQSQYKIFAEEWGCQSFRDAYLKKIREEKRRINPLTFPLHIDIERLNDLNKNGKIINKVASAYVGLVSFFLKFIIGVRKYIINFKND